MRSSIFHHLLVPLDGSEYAERALGFARNLAMLTSARVMLLAITEPSDGGTNISEAASERRTHVEQAYLEDQAHQLRGEEVRSVATEVVSGHPGWFKTISGGEQLGVIIAELLPSIAATDLAKKADEVRAFAYGD